MFLRNKNSYFAIGAIVLVFLAGILFFNYEKNNTPEAEAAAADNVMGFAWSENIGWISFNSTNCDPDGDNVTEGGVNNVNFPQCPDGVVMNNSYGVNLNADNTLSGYAWSSNIGWISFNRADTGVPPGAPYNGAETYIAKLDGADNLTGWARALSFGGGWDGWIKLRKDPFVAPAYGVNLNGTDFEGFAWGDMVVGWVSFNSKNCDSAVPIGQSDGGLGCPVAGTPMSAYKVYLGNSRPIVSNLNIIYDYCANDLNSIKFMWSFADIEDDLVPIPQSAYKIDLLRNDAAICSISENNDDLFITAAEINQMAPVLNCPGFIDYNYNYTWKVTVWDSGGLSDTESYAGVFNTPDHQYPTANFSYTPASPVPQFQTVAFDPSLSQTFGGFSIASWVWDFGDASPLETIIYSAIPPIVLVGDTSHMYSEAGTFTVDLKVTDNSPQAYSCWASDRGNEELITVEISKPTWNEVEPES